KSGRRPALVGEVGEHARAGERRIGIGANDLFRLHALELLGVTEHAFAAVAAEVHAVGITGREVPAFDLGFGAGLAAGNGVEALRDAVADRIHRRHARLHGWHGA